MAVRLPGEVYRSRSRKRGVGPARPRMLAVAVCALVAAGLTGCDKSGSSATAGAGAGRLRVVAAENFWGSIASQLGGSRVDVSSILVNPDTDPHSYEPTAADARTLADARLAIVNGIGYDEWAPKLLAASSAGGGGGREVLNVGDALGLKDGDNPHQWYAPASVERVVGAIVAGYDRLDPAGAAYYAARERTFETESLARYDRLRAQIRARYAGTPVGYSESIFRPLGEDLGLKLLTPYSFARAIAEGGEVSAQDKRTVDRQAQRREIAVWVFNSQNITPDVQRVSEIARARGIPIATVTETLAPASDSFERWQVTQLEELMKALRAGTGR